MVSYIYSFPWWLQSVKYIMSTQLLCKKQPATSPVISTGCEASSLVACIVECLTGEDLGFPSHCPTPQKKVQKGSETASASKFLCCFPFLETCMWRNRDGVFDKTALREELIITTARNVVIQYLHHPVVVWLGLTFLSPLSVWISDWHQLCKFEWKKNEEATKQV